MKAHRMPFPLPPRFAACASFCCVLLVAACGCNSGRLPTYPAGGKVTFADGQPLAGGWIEFRAKDLTPPVSARGEIKPDGTFRLGTYEPGDGAVVGQHQALIVPPQPLVDRDELRGPPPSPIDLKYCRFDTSPLVFTVSADSSKNEFDVRVAPPAGG
jgi:hypothetical protein